MVIKRDTGPKLLKAQSVSEIHRSLGPSIKYATKCYSIKKSASQVDLNRGMTNTNDRYRWWGTPKSIGRDYSIWDDYWWDRRFYMSPLYWPFSRTPGHRYNYVEPTTSLWYYFPGLWAYPKYAVSLAENDQLDALYWRRWRDPSYDRAWWKPWQYEIKDVSQALQMYRQGLVDFATLDKNWLRPSFYRRRNWDKANLGLNLVYRD